MPLSLRKISVKKMTASVLIALIASFGLLLAVSHLYLKKLTENYVQSWLAAETISIDEGQLLPVFIKSQRMLLSSKMISGLAVLSFVPGASGPEYLMEFGDKIEMDQVPKELPRLLETSSIGLFTYLVRYRLPNKQNTVAIFLSRWPSAIFEYVVLVTFVLLMAVFVAGYVFFVVKREAEIRDLVLKEGLSRLVRNEDPGPMLVSEVPSIVDSWQEMRGAMQSYQKREIENQLQLQFAQIAKQVVHDIRSPISALKIGVEKMRQVAPDASDLIAQATERIQITADSLMKKAKSNAENMTRASLKSLASALVAEKRLEYNARADIRFHVDGEDSFAWVQPRALQNILSNLINNSVEAMPEGGNIFLEISSSSAGGRIRIGDTGRGIPPEMLSKLGSTPLSAGKENSTSGLGIGLFSAKQTIESWNGKLIIESQINQGTTVTLEFGSYA